MDPSQCSHNHRDLRVTVSLQCRLRVHEEVVEIPHTSRLSLTELTIRPCTVESTMKTMSHTIYQSVCHAIRRGCRDWLVPRTRSSRFLLTHTVLTLLILMLLTWITYQLKQHLNRTQLLIQTHLDGLEARQSHLRPVMTMTMTMTRSMTDSVVDSVSESRGVSVTHINTKKNEQYSHQQSTRLTYPTTRVDESSTSGTHDVSHRSGVSANQERRVSTSNEPHQPISLFNLNIPGVEAASMGNLHHVSETLHEFDSSETEFDVFSTDYLSKQFILVYRQELSQQQLLVGQYTNVTRSILATYQPYLQLIMELDSLPGSVVQVDLEGVDHDGWSESIKRQQFLNDLLNSMRTHPNILFLSQNQPLDLTATTQSVEPGVFVSPGIRRILGGSETRVATAASVGVAVLDTGIDLDHPYLNAFSGVNCITFVERLIKKYRYTRSSLNQPVSESDSTTVSSPSLRFKSTEDDDEGDDPERDGGLAMDDNNHGTHVAGIIGGKNVPDGVVGIAPGTPVWSVKILNSKGQGSSAHLLCGINWLALNAKKNNIKIASMSLAGPGLNDNACGERNSDALHKAICQATKEGINFVAAVGNSAADLLKIVPASYPEVLGVTAIADSDGLPGSLGPPMTCRGYEGDDHVASFSNFALIPVEMNQSRTIYSNELFQARSQATIDWLHASAYTVDGMNHSLSIMDHLVSAPGSCILSTIRSGRFGLFSGTSQACPYVSGLLALDYGSSGSMDGPCAQLSPAECMNQLVERAHSMEVQAQYGYEPYPWSMTQPDQSHSSQSDIVLVDVNILSPITSGHLKDIYEIQRKDLSSVHPQPAVMVDQTDSDDHDYADRDRDSPFNPYQPIHPRGSLIVNMTAPLLMRRYYGPLVVGRMN